MAIVALLGKKAIQNFATRQLSLFKDATPPDEQIISEWFGPSNSSFRQMTLKKFETISSTAGHRVNFLSPESILNLFTWSLSADIPQEVEINAEAEVNLFFLTLAFNDELLKKYELPARFMDETGRPSQHGILAMNFSQSDIINPDYAQLIYGQFYRAMALLDFMEQSPKFQVLYQHFLNVFGFQSKDDYIKAVGAAVLPLFKASSHGSTTFRLPDDEEYERNKLLFRQLAVPDIISPQEDDFLELRGKPFQETNEDEYRAIFDLFQVKMVYTGLYFRLLSFVQNDGTLFKGDYTGTFRLEFSEGVLVYNVLNKIFSKPGTIKITGDDFKPLPVEPDYYARDVNDIFLFESKDFFMPGSIKASYDFPRIEAELMKRLYYATDSKTGKTKNGAVKQVVCNVGRIIEKAFKKDAAYDLNQITIFPCIIVHDSVLNVSGLNFLVNEWFNDEMRVLKNDPRFVGFDFDRVMPVTIIEIDSLLLLQEAFKSDPTAFGQLLRDFHAHVQLNYNGGFNTLSDVEVYTKTSVLPFAEFARSRINGSQLLPAIEALLNQFKGFGVPDK